MDGREQLAFFGANIVVLIYSIPLRQRTHRWKEAKRSRNMGGEYRFPLNSILVIRQTFVTLYQSMDASIKERMERLLIHEVDLVEKFVHGSGPGGQKINKTASCVYLRHIPSKIEIHCQESRSRDRNREIARERLCDRIEELRKKEFLQKARQRAKDRFKKTKSVPRRPRQRCDNKRKCDRTKRKIASGSLFARTKSSFIAYSPINSSKS